MHQNKFNEKFDKWLDSLPEEKKHNPFMEIFSDNLRDLPKIKNVEIQELVDGKIRLECWLDHN